LAPRLLHMLRAPVGPGVLRKSQRFFQLWVAEDVPEQIDCFAIRPAVLLLLSWPANAEDRLYYTFSEWARLQDDDRVAYISGLLDTFVMAATEPAQRTAQHYSQCITRSRLTSKQLANYLREYGRARPEMQANSVQDAMNNYVNALCGQPPG
jgi:hypothetical protein